MVYQSRNRAAAPAAGRAGPTLTPQETRGALPFVVLCVCFAEPIHSQNLSLHFLAAQQELDKALSTTALDYIFYFHYSYENLTLFSSSVGSMSTSLFRHDSWGQSCWLDCWTHRQQREMFSSLIHTRGGNAGTVFSLGANTAS